MIPSTIEWMILSTILSHITLIAPVRLIAPCPTTPEKGMPEGNLLSCCTDTTYPRLGLSVWGRHCGSNPHGVKIAIPAHREPFPRLRNRSPFVMLFRFHARSGRYDKDMLK